MSKTPIEESNEASTGLASWLPWRGRKLKDEAKAEAITQQTDISFGLGTTTVTNLLGGQDGNRMLRDRNAIYDQWQDMEAFPIISTGLGLLTTAALGGHETTGQLVFLEKNPAIKGDKAMERMAQEIADDLVEHFNSIAPQMGYVSSWGGDSYCRIYTEGRKGVVGLYYDEAFLPPLVQPYEQGGKTVGFAVYSGEKSWDRLSVMQLARMKMPRMQFIPQHAVLEKVRRQNVTEDDRNKAPIVPSMVGGSLLYNCESAYHDLRASLLGMVGSRIQDSINEEVLGLNMSNMTKAQQQELTSGVTKLLTKSRDRALEAIKKRKPVMERIRHIIPVNSDKQMFSVLRGSEQRVNAITIDDVLFHARSLAGGIGLDLSMLGWSDQMAGGLGEGGFFRNSAQVGERSRVIRASMSACFDHVIDVHTALKYGVVFPQGRRPVLVNFYGAISALENERANTKMMAINAAAMQVQTIEGLRNLGWGPAAIEMFMTRSMGMDEAEAKLYAAETKPPAEPGGFGGGGE